MYRNFDKKFNKNYKNFDKNYMNFKRISSEFLKKMLDYCLSIIVYDICETGYSISRLNQYVISDQLIL